MQTTIIEKYLSSVDQATFQKMMNHLLHLEGYKFISSPGSVIGKNKTSKGSPDSFFEDGDNFIFCEYTTQQRLSKGETFFKKLKSDVDHCFNFNKTKIDKTKISKIILAFTEEIKPSELNELKEKIKAYNTLTELIIYSIQEIPFRLVYYPGLTEKYVAGVKTTNGSIYTLSDFLLTTDKGLQPSLTNPFVGREKELEQAKEYLLANDILIITGSQGVGKSKMAAYLSENFESELGYEARVIAGSPVPLWEDLNNFILPDKKYIIFFDDANKSLPNLDYLLQFINSREKDTVKVIITVRDYVRQDLNKFLLNIPSNEITLNVVEDKQIVEIIKGVVPNGLALDILALERIVLLSKGNSRLALMCVSSILKNNDVQILNNIVSLYDQYFQKVKSDLEFLEKPNNLKALGILSFFGVIDRNNLELKNILEQNFKINWNGLWEVFLELEKVELVDILHKEVVKISDQVLSTYVFYKTFVDENTFLISYTDWLVVFIEKHDQKVNKTLIDLINTFGVNELKDRITTIISDFKNKIEHNKVLLNKFYSIFWFFKEMDTLIFIQEWVNELQEEDIELSEIKFDFEANDYVWTPEYLKIIVNFWYNDTQFEKEAIDLGLRMMFKQPSKIPEILKHVKDNFDFQRHDYRNGYARQKALIEILVENNFTKREKGIANQLFLSLANSYLKWECSQITSKNSHQMAIYNFTLVKTDSLMALRKKILENSFLLFDENKSKVFKLLKKYTWSSKDIDISIYSEEQLMVSDFFKANLNYENYSHCKLIYSYVNTLNNFNIELTSDWNMFLNSNLMQIAKIFTSEFEENNLNYDEREKKQEEDLKLFFKNCDIEFVKNTFNQLDIIFKDKLDANDNNHQIEKSLNDSFQVFAESDIELYYKALELIILGKYSFELTYGNIIFSPIKNKLVDLKKLYELINRYEYKQKQYWKQMFFEAIEENQIDEYLVQEFIGFIYSIQTRFYLNNVERYLQFNGQFIKSKKILPILALEHENIITYVTEILLSKIENTDVNFGFDFCKNSAQYFTNKVDLLKTVYFIQKLKHNDYNCHELESVSDLDHYFLIEYLTTITKNVKLLKYDFDHLKLNFIWNYPEYDDIIFKAMEIIIEKAPIFSNFEHQTNVLFKGLKINEELLKKVYRFISSFIAKNYHSKQHIKIIFNVIAFRFNDKKINYLKEFLLLNNDVEFIKNLWLDKNEVLVNSSRVPKIENHIKLNKEIIEMVKTLPNPLNYYKHISFWEKEIEYLKKDIKEEMKRDFVDIF